MDNSLYRYALAAGVSPTQRLRKQLLRDIYHRNPLGGRTMEELNHYYGYAMEPHAYQLMLLRVIDPQAPDASPPLDILLRVEEKLRRDLIPVFRELETCVLDDRILCFFNITTHRDSPATDQFKLSIGRFFAELSTSGAFEGWAFVMSEGTPAESVEGLDQCLQSAIAAMEYGAVYGLNQRYDSYEQMQTIGDIMSILTAARKSHLRQLVETLNLSGLSDMVLEIFQDSYEQVVDAPVLAYQLPHRLLELTADAAAAYYVRDGALSPLLSLWHQRIDDCLDLEKLRQLTVAGITDVFDQCRRQLSEGRSPSVIKAKAYINEHYREKIYLEDIARHVHLNHQYLSVLFKKETGVSISDYVTEVRMERARYLLRNTTESVGTIAETVGYPDPQYFSRRFRRSIGTSPQRYRSQSNGT